MATTTVNVDIKVQSKSLVQLEEELQDINEQLKQVPIGSQAFNELSKEAQGLTKELDKANKAAEGFTDDKKFMAADGAVKVLGGSLAGVVGALGTLGVESEAFGEFERKAASAIAVAVGLKDISEGFRQIRESTVLATAATELFGKVSKRALIATGIGALVVALGTIVAYWDEIVGFINGSNDELEKQNSLIEQQVADSDLQLELLRLERNAVNLRGEDETVIVAEIRKQLLLEQEQYKQLLDNLEVQLEREKSQAREVTLWEKIKIGAATAVSLGSGLNEATKAVSENNEKTAELQDKINEAKKRALNVDIQIAQLDREETDRKTKAFEERKAREDAEKDKALAEEQARLQALEDIRKEYAERRRDDAAITNEQMVMLEQQRALEELEALNATEEQKADIIAYYADKIKLAQDADREEKRQADIDAFNEEIELEKAKLNAKQQAVGVIAELAGEETKIGKLLFAAKQAIAFQESLLDLKRITFKGQNAIAEAAVNQASNVSESSKIGFPQNLITIAAAIAQGVAVVGAVKKAVSKTKATGADATIPAPTAALTPPTPAPVQNIIPQAPQTFEVSPTTRAYVLSGDVTSNQEADSKLNTKRTII